MQWQEFRVGRLNSVGVVTDRRQAEAGWAPGNGCEQGLSETI